VILTVGHSNRTLDEFVALLRGAGVRGVADVRRFPRSRRHPWFDRESLAAALPAAGVAYAWFEALGGLRDAPPDARPFAGLDPQWQGYAAHMGTPAFRAALDSLIRFSASHGPVAVMCAERTPEGCHRHLLSDALATAGEDVRHLTDPGHETPHRPHPRLVIEAGRLGYPPAQPGLFD
jgi:uncharacterized protein (DUF488 family)